MYPSNRLRQTLPKPKSPKWPFLVAALLVVVVIVGGLSLLNKRGSQPDATNSATENVVFDKQRFSLTDPASPWLVVNKKRPLAPLQYEPSLVAPNVKLRQAATNSEMQMAPATAAAVQELFAAAKDDGLQLMVASAFRSYSLQNGIYNREVKTYGQATADQQSARPGHSEHQTGWAVDVEPASGECEIDACFADTPEGKWVAANAYKYGFILRYPDAKTAVTGYEYEPWHLRYVGKELAVEMHRTGVQTLEEFFELPAAPNY
jgi:D-alanyl-D-alanine carboxypeptidase